MNTLSRALAAGALIAAMTGANAQGQEVTARLPATLIFSAYDVGSAGYAEASAIADALGRNYGTRIRIQPSGTAIGRLEPLLRGRADYAFLATEAFFLSEGLYDFAAPDQGPRRLRALMGRPAALAMATAADAGIESFEDLRGKRYALGVGNPSLEVKCGALLAFGGMTYDDLDVVEFPTYNAAMSSIAAGQADATCSTTTPSQFYELAESPRGLHWLETPASDEAGWAALQAVLPIMSPIEESIAAGLQQGETRNFAAYRYPQIVVTEDATEEDVYEFTKALDESYPSYRDATASMVNYAIDRAGVPPIDVPFHPGAIRYLREQGVWDDAADAWNEDRLAREETIQQAWTDFTAGASDLDGEAFSEAWMLARDEALAN